MVSNEKIYGSALPRNYDRECVLRSGRARRVGCVDVDAANTARTWADGEANWHPARDNCPGCRWLLALQEKLVKE